MATLANIVWLGTKELRSFGRDYVLLGLVVYSFSLAILAQAQSSSQELHNAAIAIVDEDRSTLSRQITQAFLHFKPPVAIAERDIVPALNAGTYTFVLDIPPRFQADLLGLKPARLQLDIDATAMVQAGLGAAYAQQIVADEVARFVGRAGGRRRRRSHSSRASPSTPMPRRRGSRA